MDGELRRLVEAIDKLTALYERLDGRLDAVDSRLDVLVEVIRTPVPHDIPPVTYFSGRWKTRDGTMFGR